MRGPGNRVNLDVRRLWRCPVCHYERRAPATEVAVHCHCSKSNPPMKLVEPRRKQRPASSPLDLYLTVDDLLPDETAALMPASEEEPLPAPALPLSREVREELGEDPITPDDV